MTESALPEPALPEPGMTGLAMMNLTDVGKLLRSRQVSASELTQQMLARIEQLDSIHHSYVTVMAEEALAQARVVDREIGAGQNRGPLHGVPVAIKDICYTPGTPTSCGALMMADWEPEPEATVVANLRQSGAIILGKLHMTEFALRWHHPYRPVPVNPWDQDGQPHALWPGVSSSGSGVATAAGLCFGALGTDTGGSIRFPAASCNIVGLKPTYGRVSRHGVFPLGESLDNVGPLARSVSDAAAMLGAIAGYDPNDPTSSKQPVPDYLSNIELADRSVRIGIDRAFISEDVHPEVSAAVLTAIDVLGKSGYEIVEVAGPNLAGVNEAWYTITAAEAVAGHDGIYPERSAEYGPFRELLDDGAKLSAADYAKAQTIRDRVAAEMAAILGDCDVFLCPFMAAPTPYMDAEGNAMIEEGYSRSRFSYPINFSRNPSLVLPCGMSSDHRPISLQIVGRHFEEDVICQVGHSYERETEWHQAVPPMLR